MHEHGIATWCPAEEKGKEKFTGMIPLTLINLRRRMLYMKHKIYRLDNVWRIIIIALLLMFLWIWGKVAEISLLNFSLSEAWLVLLKQ